MGSILCALSSVTETQEWAFTYLSHYPIIQAGTQLNQQFTNLGESEGRYFSTVFAISEEGTMKIMTTIDVKAADLKVEIEKALLQGIADVGGHLKLGGTTISFTSTQKSTHSDAHETLEKILKGKEIDMDSFWSCVRANFDNSNFLRSSKERGK